jgi:hypothetical protein
MEEKLTRQLEGDQHEIVYTDGGFYRRTLKQGLRDSYGKYCYPNGISYEGQWQEDAAKGKGTLSTQKFTH